MGVSRNETLRYITLYLVFDIKCGSEEKQLYMISNVAARKSRGKIISQLSGKINFANDVKLHERDDLARVVALPLIIPMSLFEGGRRSSSAARSDRGMDGWVRPSVQLRPPHTICHHSDPAAHLRKESIT